MFLCIGHVGKFVWIEICVRTFTTRLGYPHRWSMLWIICVWVVVLVEFCHYRSHQTRTSWMWLLESLTWQNRFYKRNGTGPMVICKRRQGALIFKGIIRLCYSPSPQAYACGVCSCWTTATASDAVTTAVTTAQAVPNLELLKVTVEVLDLTEQVL